MRALLALVLCLLAGLLFAARGAPAQPEAPTALLVANSAYRAAAMPPLLAPAKNAAVLAEELRHAGFAVDVQENLGKAGMEKALLAFLDKITPGSAALFFFSGHAIQARGTNYLIPVDADVWTENDVREQGISVESVAATMDKGLARTKLFVIDASRRNPFERRFRSLSAGLGPFALPPESLLIASTDLGKVTDYADADSSVFIGELSKEMQARDLTADEVFNRTRIGVARATNGEQRPFVFSSLRGDYFFNPRPGLQYSAADMPRQGLAAARKAVPQDQQALIGLPAGNLRPGTIFRDCADCPDLVIVPAGEFDMGSDEFDSEKPVHRVVIAKSFAIGRTEVTFAQWDACVADGGCSFRPDDHGRGRTTLPVSEVSWSDARALTAWLTRKLGHAYRLPSEAEWEYAARGGTQTPFWWGGDAQAGFANCRGCGGGGGRRPVPVGSFQANPFGLYDTAGNVAEWVEDCWTDSYEDAASDGRAKAGGPCKQRVLRGGSFDAGPRYARSAARFLYDAELRYYPNGFRVLRELP